MVAMPLKICQVTTSVPRFDLSKKYSYTTIQWPSGVIRSVSFIKIDRLQSAFSLKIRLVLISAGAIANHDVMLH